MELKKKKKTILQASLKFHNIFFYDSFLEKNISGHNDLGDYWKSLYDTSTFEEDVAVLFDQLLPLYQHLHSYVRRKLKEEYGPEIFPSTGHIPAHLLGYG